jgi:thiamine pyrophosphokinase
LAVLPRGTLVIAADGGLAQAEALGRRVDVVVGDMDSVAPKTLERARDAGAEIERHPRDKDATDLQLALDRAVAAGCDRVIVVGGDGGRLDHLLGNALVLIRDAYKSVAVEWWTRHDRATVVRSGRRPVAISGTRGDLVSLLPLAGPAQGVSTTGLRWALDDEDLEPGTTRGISNELTGPQATVSVRSGTVLAVHRPSEEVS